MIQTFHDLTGNAPFPWQTALYQRFIAGEFPPSTNIPTGLGKTSVVAVWLLALANAPTVVPRRLVYVVNRRTVVDQTTAEAERLRKALSKPELTQVRNTLSSLCALPLPVPEASPLAISTLRGQFADNGEWRADPARPAIIVGTVDMIGSGLLFSRYTAGFKTRPLHAGFLAQDTLLVHDEAHLEPAFQTLLEKIEAEQKRCGDFRPMRIMELTATSRSPNGSVKPFGLDENLDNKDTANEIVAKRFNAVKHLSFVPLNEEKLDEKIIEISREAAKKIKKGRTILIFVRSVENALKISEALNKNETKGHVATLTGTMRGQERDGLVSTNSIFQRFLPQINGVNDTLTPMPQQLELFADILPPKEEHRRSPIADAVFLIATSAGEVGVNISADDCICDLSTYESMAQRFGRINRFGDRDDSTITVVHETIFGKKDQKGSLIQNELDLARQHTFELLKKLPKDASCDGAYSASPAALAALPADERAAAFSPPPALRIATEVQFDAWALTSIRESIAARPPVAPYLHGEGTEWQPPETYLAWRDDLDFHHVSDIAEFYDIFPLHSCELLRDTTKRIVTTLKKMLKDQTDPVVTWLIAADGSIEIFKLSADDQNLEDKLAHATLILPKSLGGLEDGLFIGKGTATDVSGIERRESDTLEKANFILNISQNEDEPRYQLWFTPVSSGSVGVHADFERGATTLEHHNAAVTANASAIAAKLNLAPAEYHAIVAAAQYHDYGKNSVQWQHSIGNRNYPAVVLAKSDRSSYAAYEHYRHEFGSLAQLATDSNTCDLAAHIVGAHHGRSRPHFPSDEIFAPDCSPAEAHNIACTVPRRFAALQHKYGRWGLAYLESLLRAADYAASAGIVATSNNTSATTINSTKMPTCSATTAEPSASLALDPLNPGHFFACCGLFELASRLASEALSWFEQKNGQWYFHLAHTPTLNELVAHIVDFKISAVDNTLQSDVEDDDGDDDDLKSETEKEASAPPITFGAPFNMRLDWWTTPSRDMSALKTWAGSMKVLRIANAMRFTLQKALASQSLEHENLLFDTRIALNPLKISKGEAKISEKYQKDITSAREKADIALIKAEERKSGANLENEKIKIEKRYNEALQKATDRRNMALEQLQRESKAEPFYFDAKRGPNADSRDVGFSPNDLKLRTNAAPAVELLTLVGLQRAIPNPVGDRLFEYHLWLQPLSISLIPTAVNGLLPDSQRYVYRFESWYRTSQRKHKAFLPAKPIGGML